MKRIALVTGAARRVGRAVALGLARAGWDLYLTYHTRHQETERTAEDARAAGATNVQVEPLNLSDLVAVEAFTKAHSHHALDALILSASSYSHTPFGFITPQTAEDEFRVNAIAPLLLVQGLSASLASSTLAGGGAVIAFGDIHALGRPRKNLAPYLMSKSALHCMVETLAIELAPRVRVNAIAPGVIAWPDDTPADERSAYESRIPLARPGTPEDAAKLVQSIILDMPYVTGSIIRLDGGRFLR